VIIPALPELVDLVTVEGAARGRDPLDQVAAAEDVAAELRQLGDRLVGYFVEQARAGGCSWAQLGTRRGMTRQGAQQRYAPQVTSLNLADLRRAGLLPGLTGRATDCLERAEGHARRFRHDAIGTGHILLGILDDTDGAAIAVIRTLGGRLDRIRAAAEGALTAQAPSEPVPRVVEGQPQAATAVPIAPDGRRALDAAAVQARAAGGADVGTEHLLLAIAGAPGPAARVLADNGITPGSAAAAARDLTARYLRARELTSLPGSRSPDPRQERNSIQ
jgi:hypothetical protein